uniref:Transferrin receptor protein 1 n=1 Tax=Anabas testudineus TaxID=64144 RepID=A0AAQ6IDT4_ANATE
MDQARSTISKIFNGEPHSYTRFNLTQNMEGDNSQVEMKLSSDVDEEVGGNGVGDHLNHNSNRKPYVAQKFGRTPKNLCFMAAAIFLIFLIGYLIGYLVHRKKDLSPSCSASALPFANPPPHETGAAPLMDWDKVKELLAQKLNANKFEAAFMEFNSENHQAGSPGDEDLANKVLTKFKEYGMNPWTDEHFVRVQDPPASGTNKITFKGTNFRPSGFLSYSPSGRVTGAVVYANFGEESDLDFLEDKNFNLTGKVVLVRAGKISFAEKVANAAKRKAAAVLICPGTTDDSIGDNIELFGHVHMGSGDPYTPGFPSFNHTQFPPVQSSGLPTIPAQTITKGMASNILQLSGHEIPAQWKVFGSLGDEKDVITVEVNNTLTEKRINNIFGVIKGFVDADRYVVIGAKRDARGPGFAASTVGTSVLVELARSISDMVKNDGFKPRRSIVFASWSGGEYGSIGATEWLEGYLSSLNLKRDTFSELVFEPLKLDSAAYPFLAFSGIPSISFRLTSNDLDYQYFGTELDKWDKLNLITGAKVPHLTQVAAQFAGHIALRLVHDHLLRMDLAKYDKFIRAKVVQINVKVKNVQRVSALTMQWLFSASGSYSRASRSLAADIENSDLEDIEMCRILNDRIMTVERNFLSPYVSPRDSPFRHILLGFGPHTLGGLSDHLQALRSNNNNNSNADVELFRNQFALATWTLQGCANSLAGDIWSLDNEI